MIRYYLIDYFYRKFYYHYDKDSEKEILKRDIKDMVENLYNKLLDKVVSILPEEPPLNWEKALFKKAAKKVKIIIGRLNPFIVV